MENNIGIIEKVKSFGNGTKKRWQAETPKIYRKIRNTATIVAFLVPMAGSFDGAPEWFQQNKWYIMSSSAMIAGCSQLTKKTDRDGNVIVEMPKKEE